MQLQPHDGWSSGLCSCCTSREGLAKCCLAALCGPCVYGAMLQRLGVVSSCVPPAASQVACLAVSAVACQYVQLPAVYSLSGFLSFFALYPFMQRVSLRDKFVRGLRVPESLACTVAIEACCAPCSYHQLQYEVAERGVKIIDRHDGCMVENRNLVAHALGFLVNNEVIMDYSAVNTMADDVKSGLI